MTTAVSTTFERRRTKVPSVSPLALTDTFGGDAGKQRAPIPAHSPNCNPHAERFVKTLRSECLDHFGIFGERQLRQLRLLVKQFIEQYLMVRYHQGIGGQIIEQWTSPSNDNETLGPIECRSRLGGLLNYYHRKAT